MSKYRKNIIKSSIGRNVNKARGVKAKANKLRPRPATCKAKATEPRPRPRPRRERKLSGKCHS